MPEFLAAFRAYLAPLWVSSSPWGLVGQWEGLVEQCVEGYGWDLTELGNDLFVRDLLERVFTEPALKDYSVVPHMRERVAAADEAFRGLLLPDVRIGRDGQPWWHRGVFRYGGEEYVEAVARRYGIRVAPAPEPASDEEGRS